MLSITVLKKETIRNEREIERVMYDRSVIARYHRNLAHGFFPHARKQSWNTKQSRVHSNGLMAVYPTWNRSMNPTSFHRRTP